MRRGSEVGAGPQAAAPSQLPSSQGERFGVGRDALLAAAFAAATILTRLPFRAQRAFNWDAANFVLALSRYDVRLHRPHPPGYPVFIALGRALQVAFPDPNSALVVAAMLLSAGAVAALFWLGRTLWGRSVGVVAAVYLLSSVTFWTNGAVALAYPSLALFGTLVALLAWGARAAERVTVGSAPQDAGRRPALLWLLALSAAYAVGAGFRPDLLLFLLPLWVWGHGRQPPRNLLLSGALVGAMLLAWFVPMVSLSGGWEEYWKVFRAYTGNDVLRRYSVAANGPRALAVNLRDTVQYGGYALYALALPVAGAAVWLVAEGVGRLHTWGGRSTGGRGAPRPVIWLFALWIAPVLLFYAWVHIGDPGYAFTFTPPLLLLAARFTVELPRLIGRWLPQGRRTLARFVAPALVVAVVLLNTGVFLTRPLPLTAQGIRRQDATIDAKVAYVRATSDPQTTLLIAYESYRQWLLYLPEYRVRFVDVTYGTAADRTVMPPPGTTTAILMDATLLRTLRGTPYTDEAMMGTDRVATVHVTEDRPLQFDPVASPLNA